MRTPLWRFITILLLAVYSAVSITQAEEILWSTGPAFEQAAERWVSLTYLDAQNEVRTVCSDLAAAQKVSVVLDRRLDPRRRIDLQPPVAGPFREVIERLAGSQQATSRTVGDSLFVLPLQRAGDFKTLIALRTEEIPKAVEKDRPSNAQRISRMRELTGQKAYSWTRRATPRELVVQACQSTGVAVQNPEIIPHDLWDAGTLPRASLVEWISFVLFQYEMTFKWQSGTAVQIVPIPEQVEIERYHSLPASLLAEHRDELEKQFPEASWQQRGSRWQINGPEDLHERINALKMHKAVTSGKPRIPWRSHTFTMRVQQNPLGDVLDYLQQAGVPVEYEAERLEQLGIDPKQKISFEVTDVKAEGLFKAICEPLKLPYRITEEAVLIAPQD